MPSLDGESVSLPEGDDEVRILSVDLGTHPVPWGGAGTAFGNAVASLINARGVAASWGPLPNGLFRCAPERDASMGMLISVPVGDEIRCFIIGGAQFAAEKAVPIWQDVVASAVAAVRHRQKFFWSALIGPSPRSVGSNYVLASGIHLGSAELKAAKTYMREWTHNPLNDMLGRSAWGSWPVVVSGTGLAFDSEGAREFALSQLNRMCGLISVAWNCWWTVRHGPYAFSEPQHLTVYPFAFSEEAQLFRDEAEPKKKMRELPGWVEDAWFNLDKFPHLEVALGSFYEAIRLSLHHPSFAFIGFVAAIESVGAGPVSNSSGKIKNRPSSKRAFTAGLSTVTDADVARKLANSFYGRRSATAHVGVLHGLERRFGWPTNIYFGTHPSKIFLQDATQIRTLSRIVLANALMRAA
jgi:hypothetical protein